VFLFFFLFFYFFVGECLFYFFDDHVEDEQADSYAYEVTDSSDDAFD